MRTVGQLDQNGYLEGTSWDRNGVPTLRKQQQYEWPTVLGGLAISQDA